MRIFAGLIIVGCLTLTACSDTQNQTVASEESPAEVTWSTLVPDDMTATQIAQKELCVSATNVMASELMGELMAALDSGDPAAAIKTCGEKAPAIAAQISADYGVNIGRTSHKLRNSANAPPEWAQQIVADQVAQPTYLEGPHGEFGALLPIRLKAECQMCHGPKEEIDEAILTVLAETYPDDAATDFVDGDLRGWFWIEAPTSDLTS